MAQSRKQFERYLSKDERDLCEQARQPALRALKQEELTDLARRLRERRDRARSLSRDQRRKARATGGKPGDGESGIERKKALLASGVQRVNRELERRRARIRGETATRHLRKALKRKRTQAWSGPEYRNADEGMVPNPNEKIAPSGALHAEGHKAALGRAIMER